MVCAVASALGGAPIGGSEQAAVAVHQLEQPDDTGHFPLVDERHPELTEIDLRLVAERISKRLAKAGLPAAASPGALPDSGVAALVAAVVELAPEASPGQARRGRPARAGTG